MLIAIFLHIIRTIIGLCMCWQKLHVHTSSSTTLDQGLSIFNNLMLTMCFKHLLNEYNFLLNLMGRFLTFPNNCFYFQNSYQVSPIMEMRYVVVHYLCPPCACMIFAFFKFLVKRFSSCHHQGFVVLAQMSADSLRCPIEIIKEPCVHA